MELPVHCASARFQKINASKHWGRGNLLVSLGNGRRAPASDIVRGRTDAEAAGHSRWKRKRCGYLRLKGGLRQEDDLNRCNCGEGEHGCNDGDVSGTGGRLQKRGGQLQRSKRGDAGQLGAVVPGRWRPREGRRREPVVVELSVLAATDRARTRALRLLLRRLPLRRLRPRTLLHTLRMPLRRPLQERSRRRRAPCHKYISHLASSLRLPNAPASRPQKQSSII